MPNYQLLREMEQLSERGESSNVLKYLRINFALPTNPWNVAPGQRVGGKYTLIEKVASGGMGVIYRANQDLIDRVVAIKMIHPALANEQMFARLKEEIATLGLLDHPGIVRIYDADVHKIDSKSKNEAVFYTMELVEGPTLRQWMKEGNPSLEEKLKFFAQVCDATNHAHQAGVIHRDLKPENILVRKDGSPAVLDFGLSKVNAAARRNVQSTGDHLPSPTDFSGTPAYMSPEKWDRSGDGAAGDLYALGVILHELIWGERPLEFDSCDSFEEMQEMAGDWSFGGTPQNGGFTLDENLRQIICRLLEKRPEDRPKNAGEVAGIIRDILHKTERRKKFKKRLPYLIGTGILIVVFFAGWLHSVARQRAMQQSRMALLEAQSLSREGAPHVSSKVLALLPRQSKDRHSETEWKELVVDAFTSWEIDYSTTQIQELKNILSISEDGERFFGVDHQNHFTLYDRGLLHSFIPADFVPSSIAIHPQKPLVVVSRDEGRELDVLGSKNGSIKLVPSKAIHPKAIGFSPDGRRFACATQPLEEEILSPLGPHSELLLYNATSWEPVPITFGVQDDTNDSKIRSASTRTITGLAFSHDSSRLATWSSVDSGIINVWDATSGKLMDAAFVGGGIVRALWDSNSHQILCVRSDGHCAIWDFRQWHGITKKLPLKNAGHIPFGDPSQLESLGWLPGNTGFLWQEEGLNRIHLKRPERIQSLELEAFHEGEPLRWNPVKQTWYHFNQSGIRSWTLRENAHRSLSLAGQENQSLAFAANSRLVTVGDTSGARLLDIESLDEIEKFSIPLYGPAIMPPFCNDLWLYTKWEGPVRWGVQRDASTHCLEIRKNFSFLNGSAGLMAISDGSELIAASIGHQILLKYPTNAGADHTLITPTSPQSLTVHPDGSWLAAGAVHDGWLHLWKNAQSGWVSAGQSVGLGVPFFSRWSKDELLLLTSDHLIAIALNQLTQKRVLLKTMNDVTAMSECTGQPLLALAKSGTISILNVQNEFESELDLPVEMQFGDVIRTVQFNHSGTRLAAIVDGSGNDTLHIWNLGAIASELNRTELGFKSWTEVPEDVVNSVACIDLELGVWNRFK